jgi:hypothetical protein
VQRYPVHPAGIPELLPPPRHLYCLEPNRPSFRRLFSPELFAAFIDIGGYQQQLQEYLALAAQVRVRR